MQFTIIFSGNGGKRGKSPQLWWVAHTYIQKHFHYQQTIQSLSKLQFFNQNEIHFPFIAQSSCNGQITHSLHTPFVLLNLDGKGYNNCNGDDFRQTEEQLKSRSSGGNLSGGGRLSGEGSLSGGNGRRKLANERVELDLLSTRYT